jgi:hypothetical protein
MVNLAMYPKQYGSFPGGDLISAPFDTNVIAELYSRVLCTYLLRVYLLQAALVIEPKFASIGYTFLY